MFPVTNASPQGPCQPAVHLSFFLNSILYEYLIKAGKLGSK